MNRVVLLVLVLALSSCAVHQHSFDLVLDANKNNILTPEDIGKVSLEKDVSEFPIVYEVSNSFRGEEPEKYTLEYHSPFVKDGRTYFLEKSRFSSGETEFFMENGMMYYFWKGEKMLATDMRDGCAFKIGKCTYKYSRRKETQNTIYSDGVWISETPYGSGFKRREVIYDKSGFILYEVKTKKNTVLDLRTETKRVH